MEEIKLKVGGWYSSFFVSEERTMKVMSSSVESESTSTFSTPLSHKAKILFCLETKSNAFALSFQKKVDSTKEFFEVIRFFL
jgi:hypothetical protein